MLIRTSCWPLRQRPENQVNLPTCTVVNLSPISEECIEGIDITSEAIAHKLLPSLQASINLQIVGLIAMLSEDQVVSFRKVLGAMYGSSYVGISDVDDYVCGYRHGHRF